MDVRALAVIALVVTAGCSLPTSDADRTRGTVPPQLAGTPSPTQSPTAGAAGGVAGIRNGTADAAVVAAVHQRRLRLASRTITRSFAARDANGTLVGRNVAVIRATSERRGEARIRGRSGGTAPSSVGLVGAEIDYWTNGTVAASRATTNETTSYAYRDGPLPDGLRPDTTGRGLVRFAFRAANVTSVRRANNGSLFVRGTTDRDASVENVTLSARIAPSGVVSRLDVRFTEVENGRRLDVVRRLRVTEVENTTVSRPAWLPAARNASDGGETTTSASAAGDGPPEAAASFARRASDRVTPQSTLSPVSRFPPESPVSRFSSESLVVLAPSASRVTPTLAVSRGTLTPAASGAARPSGVGRSTRTAVPVRRTTDERPTD